MLRLGSGYPGTYSVRRLLEMVIEACGGECRDLGVFLSDYSVELALLEDAYITSRYVPRDFTETEVLRLKKIVEDLVNHVREHVG